MKRSVPEHAGSSKSKKLKIVDPNETGDDYADGEVEIEFENLPHDPTAEDLLQLAKDERVKLTRTNVDGDELEDARSMVIRLYEMAVKKIETAHPILEDEQGSKGLDGVPSGELVLYAQCLGDLGSFVHLEDYINRAIKIMEDALKEEINSGEGWMSLGVMRTDKIRLLDGFKSSVFDDYVGETEEDDGNDEDANEGDREQKDWIKKGKAEPRFKLLTQAESAFAKAFICFEADANRCMLERSKAARCLHNLALMEKEQLDQTSLAVNLLTKASTMLQYEPKKSITAEVQEVLECIRASCHFYLAKYQTGIASEKAVREHLEESIACLMMITSEELSKRTKEMMGQAFIMLSSVAENDEEAFDCYEQGVQILRAILEESPDKTHLKDQLKSLEQSDSEDA
ncbi:hypothetical protein HDU76_009282 [Blyttiomyces sp. JEL0837]|nr:hypothetical protein HDU76_009282 [Blyttiomyces sp. JEL0837]